MSDSKPTQSTKPKPAEFCGMEEISMLIPESVDLHNIAEKIKDLIGEEIYGIAQTKNIFDIYVEDASTNYDLHDIETPYILALDLLNLMMIAETTISKSEVFEFRLFKVEDELERVRRS